jgi:DNA invertase Pin-like site-specific DNA recombinase
MRRAVVYRPAFDKLCRDAARREFDMVMAWSVDRLGRSFRPRRHRRRLAVRGAKRGIRSSQGLRGHRGG